MKRLISVCALSLGVGALAQSGYGALELQWTFDEASGNALDTGAAPAADGVLTGGAVRSANTPSGTGSSVDLRTESPYAHVLGPDANKLDGLNQLTLTTWLNVESYPSGNHRLVAKQAGGAFGGFNFSMNATTNDGPVGADNFRLAFFGGNNVSSGASDFFASFSTVDVDAANKWVFLAVSYDGTSASDNVKFFIGDAAGNVSQLGAASTAVQIALDAGTARFGVGFTDAAPTANTSVVGYQDDVRVYSEVLDLAALQGVAAQNVPEPTSIAMVAMGGLGLIARRRR